MNDLIQMVDIAGTMVDVSKPCDIASALKVARLQIVTGGGVILTRFGEDEVRFGSADIARLDKLIADYDGQCALATGTPRTRRSARRFTYL